MQAKSISKASPFQPIFEEDANQEKQDVDAYDSREHESEGNIGLVSEDEGF